MRWYAVLAVLVLLAGSTGPAASERARDHVRSGRVLPLDQILPHIRDARPGNFYDAEGPFRGPDGRMHYSLKWMTPDGRIIWLDTDAGTGRVLGEMRGQRSPRWEQNRRYVPRGRNRGRHREYDRRDYEHDRGGDRGGRHERWDGRSSGSYNQRDRGDDNRRHDSGYGGRNHDHDRGRWH